VKLV
jgi:hypothetical protein